MPLRVLDVMGSGGFLFLNYQPGLAEFFVPVEELVLYDSMADLEDKVWYSGPNWFCGHIQIDFGFMKYDWHFSQCFGKAAVMYVRKR